MIDSFFSSSPPSLAWESLWTWLNGIYSLCTSSCLPVTFPPLVYIAHSRGQAVREYFSRWEKNEPLRQVLFVDALECPQPARMFFRLLGREVGHLEEVVIALNRARRHVVMIIDHADEARVSLLTDSLLTGLARVNEWLDADCAFSMVLCGEDHSVQWEGWEMALAGREFFKYREERRPTREQVHQWILQEIFSKKPREFSEENKQVVEIAHVYAKCVVDLHMSGGESLYPDLLLETVRTTFPLCLPIAVNLFHKDGLSNWHAELFQAWMPFLKPTLKRRPESEWIPELSLQCTLLLLAAYLASNNPAHSDARYFQKDGGQRSRKKVCKTAAHALEAHIARYSGPRPFPLSRMVTIYSHVQEEEMDVPGWGKQSALFWREWKTLLYMGHVLPVTKSSTMGMCEDVRATRFLCLTSEGTMKRLTDMIHVDIRKYMWEDDEG